MGLSGMSVWEVIMVLVVVVVLFGSKRLPGIASDLGSAIRDFRRSVSGDGIAAPSASEKADDRDSASTRQP
ncbi:MULTISPECIES: twin-arginine translocase TatA/TatE family subunit [unclassified Thiocapsa]|uniref:twin-arginine translocase TatA/TatE family subunit n=1 Tax=unclassified Thiocapsa TaxID=2641286 RepID=UPI0035B3A0FA